MHITSKYINYTRDDIDWNSSNALQFINNTKEC